MADAFTLESLFNLVMLIFLQAVLGFDNLLYISIESKRAPKADQAMVRRLGIIIAIVLRLVLLFLMLVLLDTFTSPLFAVSWTGVVEGVFTLGTIVFIFGGAFIMYTAVKEITHLLAIQHIEADVEKRGQKSKEEVIFWIVLMNLIFSFDSILSAIAITDVFLILAIAIVASGVAMIVLADRVAEFIERNRMYEILGLFILLMVGVLLLSEGGHQAHLTFFGFPVEAMSKTTFYFTLAALVVVNVIQSRYQKKLMAQKRLEIQRKV